MSQVSTVRVAQRVCLKCDKTFLSKGPQNRICPNCSRVNAQFGFIPEAVLAKQRGKKRHNGEEIGLNEDAVLR